jgi:hypothetical protein
MSDMHEPTTLRTPSDHAPSHARPLAQCTPVNALKKCSKAGPALVDQLCAELLAPANATADSKVGASIQRGPGRIRAGACALLSGLYR